MEARQEYIAHEPDLEAPTPEKGTPELSDVFARHRPLLYKTAYRYLGNPADAEDAVQDALLSAYKHVDQFRRQARMSTWLVAIVNNSARMQLRKRPRQIHVSLDEQIGDEKGITITERLADRAPSPEEECRNEELRHRIMQVTAELSPTLRKAFQLRDLDGLTTREVAKILGVVDGTVKAQVVRARTKIIRLVRQGLGAQPHSSVTCSAWSAAAGD